jgi:hypothetical protein
MGLHPAVRGLQHLHASGSNLRFRLTSQPAHLRFFLTSVLHSSIILSQKIFSLTAITKMMLDLI